MASTGDGETDIQPFAMTGVVAATRCYLLTTLKGDGTRWWQTGCAPNFQGGAITLCTCQHHMRTESWLRPGAWIAGFSSADAHLTQPHLFYLMRVGALFDAHADLWEALPNAIRQAKAAHLNHVGDLYVPSRALPAGSPERFAVAAYRLPMLGHVHPDPEQWEADIGYRSRSGRARLVVGAPESSYLWTRPRIAFQGEYRGRRGSRKWNSLGAFLDHLVDMGKEA